MKDLNGNEILLNGKTFSEIAKEYFGTEYVRECYTEEEQRLLRNGFIEGLEYLYPLYEAVKLLADSYEKIYEREN